MQRISVCSAAEFIEQTNRLVPTFVAGESESTTWAFHLPEVSGAVTDAAVEPGLHISRARLQAHRHFAFSAAHTVPTRMAKLAWVRSGRVSYAVRGARTLYDAHEGQTYLAAFNGRTETQIEMNEGETIDGLSVVLSMNKLMEAHRATLSHGRSELLAHARPPSRHPFRFTTVMTPAIDLLLSRLLASLDRSECRQAEGLFELISETLRLLDDESRWSARVVSSADIERVRRARSLMLESIEDPPSLVELAHTVGLNEFKLKAGFRQAFGTTVGSELQRARLEAARRILTESTMNIAAAAVRVGYSNPGDFSAVFKRRFGLTPSNYRSTHARTA